MVSSIVAKNVEVMDMYKIPNVIGMYQFKLQGWFETYDTSLKYYNNHSTAVILVVPKCYRDMS
jgi:hypothetical protein